MPDLTDLSLSSLVAESKIDRQPEEQSWLLNLNFLEGRQWITWDRNLNRYVRDMPKSGRNRVTVNRLLGIYRNILSRLSVSFPSTVVLPASPDTEDILKAKSSETALRYYWQEDDIQVVVTHAIQHLLTAGTSAFHTFYDPGQERVRTLAISPFDLFFECGASDPDDSSWVAIRTYHAREALKEAYPDHADEIEKSPTTNETQVTQDNNFNTQPEDRVEVFEFYWRDGTHVIALGDLVLFEEEDAFQPRCFPVQVMRYTDIPGRLWGLSLLAPLINLQWSYNRFRSRILDNVDLMGQPKWLVPTTAQVPNTAITNRPGEKIPYNPAGGTPQQVPAAPMPQYVIDNISRTQSEMDDVAGLHSVSQGKRAVGITSGKAIEALSAQDTSQLQVTQNDIEKAVRGMAKAVLSLMKAHYTGGKMMRMLDSQGRVIFNEIKSTELVDDPEVFIQAGSMFRNEAQDRDQRILDLLQLGLLDKETAMKELSFRSGDSFVSDKIASLAHARDILEAVKAGYEVEIFRTDDLVAFKEVFGEYIRDPEFYTLPQDRQDYVRDVYVAVELGPMATDAQYQEAATNDKVFPRETGPKANAATVGGNIVSPNSPEAQLQNAAEYMDTRGAKADVELVESALAQRAEALTSIPGGGAL